MKNEKLAIKRLIIFLILFFVNIICVKTAFAEDVEYAKGVVVNLNSESQNKDLHDVFKTDQIVQNVKVKILSGDFQGKEVEVDNQLTSNPSYDINLKKNERVLLAIEKTGDNLDFYIIDHERIPILYITIGLFFTLILAVGGKKGLHSLLSLIITALLIFGVLVPGIMKGYPVILLATVVSILATAFTMYIVGGFNLKSTGATLGTIISMFFAGMLALFVIKYGYLTGFPNQESQILWTSNPKLDFKGIVAASIMVGALGAVMDMCMSIASCINEIQVASPSSTRKDLIKSGMNVGKDVIGTMSNTLILAYLGGAMFLILLLGNVPMVKFLNLNSVATEISAAIVGSIGIVLSVPITALVTAYLLTWKKTEN